MDKKEMVLSLIDHYTEGNKAQFAKMLGITPQTVSSWLSRNTFDSELIYAKCEHINPEWLLSGKGEILKSNMLPINIADAVPFQSEFANMGKPIPLVHQFAVAGFGNSDFSIAEQDVKEYYVIPKFKYCKVDFMIEVHGSSMYPKYSAGDVIACTILRESKFIQWNKCHVIATQEQGILVKRIKKAPDPNHIIAVSDNKDYDPFPVPIDEITGMALVVGVVRLE